MFNYVDSFEWPAEVYRIDLATGKSESVFKQKDRRVTDAAIFAEGPSVSRGRGASREAALGADSGQSQNPREHDLKNWRGNARGLSRRGAVPGVGGSRPRSSVGRDGYRNDSASFDQRARLLNNVLQVLFYPQIVHAGTCP